jgi:hypothetical protein
LIVTQGRPTLADFDTALKKNFTKADLFSTMLPRPRFFCEKSEEAPGAAVCPLAAFPL